MAGIDYRERLRRAAQSTERAGCGALAVTPSADLVYLTSYAPPVLPRLTCLLLRPGKDPVLLVPALERPLAESTGAGSLAELVSWDEIDDPYLMLAGIVGAAERIACSERMWAVHLLGLQRALPEARFERASRVLGPLRAVKEQPELGLLGRSARAADETFRRVMASRLETMTERGVASLLEELLVETGHEEVAFTIVGSGPNGASPHHEPTDRELLAGEAVVLDYGGRTGGYCSDITRTVVIQKAPRQFDHVYEIVREAQERAFRAVAPGVPASEIDRAAREVIEQAGYGPLFLHRTGHGIGLEEHEPPYIVQGNDEPLRPGMCFSIEPGVYLPGEFGVRIEDIVTVTEQGAERLNHASRDLEVAR